MCLDLVELNVNAKELRKAIQEFRSFADVESETLRPVSNNSVHGSLRLLKRIFTRACWASSLTVTCIIFPLLP